MKHKVVSYPGSDAITAADSSYQFLRYNAGTKDVRFFDVQNPAIAHAVLAASPGGTPHQSILVLPKSNFVRGHGRSSESRSRKNTIAFLIDQKALEATSDGHHLWVTKHVLFPSPSRCSSCISRTNTNGWREWHVRTELEFIPLDEAFNRSFEGQLELMFFDELPDDMIEVPSRL